jgi:hypothetical protein
VSVQQVSRPSPARYELTAWSARRRCIAELLPETPPCVHQNGGEFSGWHQILRHRLHDIPAFWSRWRSQACRASKLWMLNCTSPGYSALHCYTVRIGASCSLASCLCQDCVHVGGDGRVLTSS